MDMTKFSSARDVVMLTYCLNQSLRMELVSLIIDHAEYWPHSTCVMSKPAKLVRRNTTKISFNGSVLMATEAASAPQGYDDTTSDSFLLRSLPLGALDSDVKTALVQSVHNAQSGLLRSSHAVGIQATKSGKSAFMNH